MFGKYFQRIGLVTFSHNIYTIFRQPLISIHKVTNIIHRCTLPRRKTQFTMLVLLALSASRRIIRAQLAFYPNGEWHFSIFACAGETHKGGEGWKGIKRFCRLVYYVGVE